jgi:uncharacterized protein (TIGR02271 family)
LFNADEDREVSPYAEAVRRGGAVVKVEVDEDTQVDGARAALEAAGAVDIEERASQWRASGWQEGTSLRSEEPSSMSASQGSAQTRSKRPAAVSDMPGRASTAPTAAADPSAETSASSRFADRADEQGAEGVVPVVKEELQVGKRAVQQGGVRVFARTVETPVSESVELRSERAEVQRRPVDRPATDADLQKAADRVIEMNEMAEEPVVSKQARVVEEVSVGKRTERRTEQVGDTVRSTDVQVQSLNPHARGTAATAGETGSRDFRSHFDSNYAASGGRWEDYEPAYRFGETASADASYQGRAWDEIEPDVRRDWEARNAGPWERFKEAVRHGWDSMTR